MPPKNQLENDVILSATLIEPMKTMYIIGNAAVNEDIGQKIDAADFVVRFNDMNHYNKGTGTKTTIWVLSSNKFLINQHIDSSKSNANKSALSINKMIFNSQSLYFSIPPFLPVRADAKSRAFQRLVNEDRNERINAVHTFLEYFKATEHPFRIIEFPLKYVNDLIPELWSPRWTCPSNGYLVTRMLIDDATYYRYKKYLIGFTWQGWDGHPWVLEKLFMEKLERDNQINIIK